MEENSNKNAQTRAIKVLYLDRVIPYPPEDGMRIRTFNILKELVIRGYEVTVVCFVNDETKKNIEELKNCLDVDIIPLFYKGAEHYNPITRILLSIFSKQPFIVKYYTHSEFKRKIKQLTKKINFDLLFISSSWVALYGININMPKILDIIDSQVLMSMIAFKNTKSAIMHRIYRYLEYKKWEKIHRKIYPLFDYLLVTAQRDADMVKSYPNTNVITIPNGVDTSYFKPLGIEKIPFSMVFVGVMGDANNRDATLYFIEEIYPIIKKKIPKACVYIVGKNPSKGLMGLHDGENIFVTGYVEDVRPYIDQCEVVVCPFRMASGIQNKILEAMAMNKPIVTTKIGAGGIERYDEKDIIVADDAEDFAQRIIELFTNRELLQEVGKGGREFVEKNYSWTSAGNKIYRLIKELINSKESHEQ